MQTTVSKNIKSSMTPIIPKIASGIMSIGDKMYIAVAIDTLNAVQ